MKKLIIVLVLLALFLCTFFLIFFDGSKTDESGIGGESDTVNDSKSDTPSGNETKYDYDLSEYVKLGAYPNVIIDKARVEELVNEAKNEIASSFAEKKEITDRAIKTGDTVNIDYVGTLEGVAFEGGTAAGYDLTIGSDSFIPGFEDGLIGKNIGEEVVLDLTFPETYHNAEMAGKAVVFTVKINKITETIVPELTDDMIKELDQADYTTVEEFNTYIKRLATELVAWECYVDSCEIIKYPDKEVEEVFAQAKTSYETQASYYGTTIETLVTAMGYSSIDVFYAELKETVKENVAAEMILYHTVRTNNITLTGEEYKSNGLKFATENDYATLEEMEEQIGKDVIMLNLYQDKIISALCEANDIS